MHLSAKPKTRKAAIGDISIIPIGGMIALKGAIIALNIFITVSAGSFLISIICMQLNNTANIIIKYMTLNKIEII